MNVVNGCGFVARCYSEGAAEKWGETRAIGETSTMERRETGDFLGESVGAG